MQVESLSIYLKSSLDIFDILNNENKDLKTMILNKNNDIVKLVGSIELNESENNID